MGVSLKDLISKRECDVSELKNKIIVIDAYNMLYQFLTSIRDREGNVLTNSSGKTTSHLIGLFSRLIYFLDNSIKPVFVFDGDAPQLKQLERKRRRQLKEEAKVKYEIAVREADIEAMKKYASRTSRLTSEMVKDARDLIKAMGIPVIQAPSEGEAQAVHVVKKGDAYACVSQDFDNLLFGAPLLIRNLNISGKRRKVHGLGMKTIKPEIIELEKVLNELGINQDQLILLGILVGTDFNIGGIKGIGPKNALKNVKKYKDNYDQMFEELKWGDYFDFSWKEVYDLFNNIPTTDDYNLFWTKINESELKRILIEDYEFSEERVESSLEKVKKSNKKKSQKFLSDF